MTKHQNNVKKAFSFLENNDTEQGFRLLINSAMDTQNMEIYKKTIALTDEKENHLHSENDFIQKCKDLLNEIGNFPITESTENQIILKAENIKKSYSNSPKGFKLSPISLEIEKGKIYGLVGENGNGKTTLLRILAKEISYDSGKISYFFSQPPKDNYDLKSQLIYIPQRTKKWYGSLKDNLKFVLSSYGISPQENEIRVLIMIARLGLWKYQNLQWNELSSGYKMRFELARTLLRQPEILFLDEPLANLDILAQQIILEDLKNIANSVNNPIGIILSSQQLYEVEKISDKVIFLKNGVYKENFNPSLVEKKEKLIIEIECKEERDLIKTILEKNHLENLQYNGGIYIATFSGETNFYEILENLGQNKIQITYIRDISLSTRRFFVS